MENEKKPPSILDLDPGKLRELDGVVLDLDSYAKHCPAPLPPAADSSPSQAPHLSEPVHVGWYRTEDTTAYPVMERYVYIGGSGSGSYLGSYRTSYIFSSGSGSRVTSGSGIFSVGGYGLELI